MQLRRHAAMRHGLRHGGKALQSDAGAAPLPEYTLAHPRVLRIRADFWRDEAVTGVGGDGRAKAGRQRPRPAWTTPARHT
jgi:hypothetical protein